MKPNRRQLPAFVRLGIAEALIIILTTVLYLPVAFATPSNRAPRIKATAAPLLGSIQVNVSNDADNLDPSSGCDTDAAVAGEQCSLRAAIQRANALAGDDEITISIPATQPNCDPGGAHCTINLLKPMPDLNTNVRIVSPGIDKVTVRRNAIGGDFGVFRVTSATEVTFSGLRIENGRPAGINAGGAIANDGNANVNVVDSIFTDNVGGVIVASGGALANNGNGTMNVVNSSFADNHATASGGAILNGGSGTLNITSSIILHNDVIVPAVANKNGAGGGVANVNDGTVNITNSLISDNRVDGGDPNTSSLRGAGVMNFGNGTINVTGSVLSNNFARKEGGGIANTSGTLHVTNSTIMQNRGNGGGIFGQGTIKSSIVAKNNAGPFAGSDVSGTFTSEGFNLIGVADGSTGFTAPTDLKGTAAAALDPKLDPTGVDVSTPALTISVPGVPLCGSPLIDKGNSNGLATDLRGSGFPRVIDDPDESNAADGADIGAFERQTVCAQISFTVNTTNDADDANPGDGNCDSDTVTAGSQCSLRAAMRESNAIGGDYTINFSIPTNDPGFDPSANRYTINLAGALPEITNSNLIINGPGKDKLIVRRNTGGFYRIFSFGGVVETTTLAGMTIVNGFNNINDGGALTFTGKTLTITGCEFSDNIAAWSGGALYVNGKLNVTDSVFNNNFSTITGGGGGGAIYAYGALNVSNSKFSDNAANGYGGAVNSDGTLGTGDSAITNSTFTGNAADAGGGVSVATAVGVHPTAMRITNSTFRQNEATLINSRGGAIYQLTGTLYVAGSTLSDNEVYGLATNIGSGSTTTSITDSTISGNTYGGIETEDSTVTTSKLNVTNSTITGNKGAGISLTRVTLNVSNSTISNNDSVGIQSLLSGSNGAWTIKSSIIAVNASGQGDVSGTFTSAGFNLIGNPSTSTGFANGVNNDQVGSSGAPLDPKLDPLGLKDNGGATQTIALQPDSPAIDKGSSDALDGKLEKDQRELFLRAFDDPAVVNMTDGTDIGAFELQPGGPTPTPTPTPTPSPSPSPSPSPTPAPSPSPTPTPSPSPSPAPQPAKIVVTTTSLVRTNCGDIAVGVTVQNVGGVTANNVKLTTGTLSSPVTNGSPLPKNFGNLAAGQWATTVIIFSGNKNSSGSKRTLTVAGTYNGGTFTESWNVKLP